MRSLIGTARPVQPTNRIHLGKNPLQSSSDPIRGEQVTLEGEDFYQIANYDRMRPFFMTVVSDADHWMFISSNGGADRRPAQRRTWRCSRTTPTTKSVTWRRSPEARRYCVVQQAGPELSLGTVFGAWPGHLPRHAGTSTRISWGNKLIFEEINEDLGLTFRYGWFNSDRFGFVRRAWLANSGPAGVRVKLLDGLQNLMPCGMGSQFNLEYSTLLDAYKRSELVAGNRPWLVPAQLHPGGSSRAGRGAPRHHRLVARAQAPAHPAFLGPARPLSSGPAVAERDRRARRNAGRISSRQRAECCAAARAWIGWSWPTSTRARRRWPTRAVAAPPGAAAEAGPGGHRTRHPGTAADRGRADGLQKTARPLGQRPPLQQHALQRHARGHFHRRLQSGSGRSAGLCRQCKQEVAARHAAFFRGLPGRLLYGSMVAAAAETGDPQLERLCREYLPLTFSRRHGDPSRPWNRFSIATRNADGTRILNYEGNWRDIFQNWEALAVSFPGYVSGMICRFLNASTADGYNPYRITRDGIDWEVVDPHDPWSYIGYWGDHQIIYLLKLLEILDRHDPAALARLPHARNLRLRQRPLPHQALRGPARESQRRPSFSTRSSRSSSGSGSGPRVRMANCSGTSRARCAW